LWSRERLGLPKFLLQIEYEELLQVWPQEQEVRPRLEQEGLRLAPQILEARLSSGPPRLHDAGQLRALQKL